MTQELRRLIDVVQREAVNDGYKDRPESDSTVEAKAMLMDAILSLLDRLEKDAEELSETVQKALNRAYQLGQTYWQQADSEYTSQHRKADLTHKKFDELKQEIRAAMEASK